MTRLPRNALLSDINHIMLRGIGHMDLFGTENDFRQFLNILRRFKQGTGIVIISYCLMDNHVHLLVKSSPEEIPLYCKRVEISYASYFNGLYEHTGHLFQNRYKSEAIKNNGHFLNALRYILRNPEKAGICKWEAYPWSNAGCFLTGTDDHLSDPSFALKKLGGAKEFLHLMNGPEDDPLFALAEPPGFRRSMNDQSALRILKQISGLENPLLIQSLAKGKRDLLLAQLKQKGMRIRQLERITGINRNIIQRAK